jgi:hypothetical protein
MNSPTRTVHTADALAWLDANALPEHASVFTSLPDAVEFRHRSVERWRPWFVAAAERVLRSTPPHACAIFYQTDRKLDGEWIDKAFLVQQAAASCGSALLWHKIVCRAPAGRTTFARPGYAHLLCFSQRHRDAIEAATADVLPELGPMTWPRAMGLAAADAAVRWLRERAAARCIVDPFCGVGTALAVANAHGLDAIGVELHAGRAERARRLTLATPPAADQDGAPDPTDRQIS